MRRIIGNSVHSPDSESSCGFFVGNPVRYWLLVCVFRLSGQWALRSIQVESPAMAGDYTNRSGAGHESK